MSGCYNRAFSRTPGQCGWSADRHLGGMLLAKESVNVPRRLMTRPVRLPAPISTPRLVRSLISIALLLLLALLPAVAESAKSLFNKGKDAEARQDYEAAYDFYS